MSSIKLPFFPDDSGLLVNLDWTGLPGPAHATLLAVVCLVPAALIVWLYRYELRLVSRAVATTLLSLRLVVLALVLFLVCLRPIYARDRTEGLPGRVIVAVDRSGSMDVTDPQRPLAEKLRLARALKLADGLCTDAQLARWAEDHEKDREPRWLADDEAPGDPARRAALEAERRRAHDEICQRVDGLTRAQISRRILGKEGAGLLPALVKAKHEVDLLGFARDSWDVKPDQLDELFRPLDAASNAAAFTDLRLPLVKALERSGPGLGKVLGVVLLTDGQHNWGEPPVKKAIELGERSVPIFPVALGTRRPPPDVAVITVKAPAAVFKDVDANVEVRFKITGLPAQEFAVELHLAGMDKKLVGQRTIRHDGRDQVYAERFPVRLDQAGTRTLVATVRPVNPETKESRADNNTGTAVINVADDKAKVLLIDGEARWEYHYLASALHRDRTMQLETVVFDQPRLNDNLTPDDLQKMGSPRQQLPAGPDALAEFDCIILGDVPADRLPLAERLRLEKYVADRGGTLVVLAGKRFMPLSYPETESGDTDPLRKLLPIESPRKVAPPNGFTVTLTSQGRDTDFMRLDPEAGSADLFWSRMPRHFWGVVGKAKPGATALAYVAGDEKNATEEEKSQALIVRHHYGFGQVLFVGLDSTWRWRFKTGDTYHHRFWGQAIRWAATNKPLVTGNEYVRFGTPRAVYRQGQEVELVVRLAEELGALKADLLAGARVIHRAAGGKEEAVALVPLTRREAQPRVFEGRLRDLPAGEYAVELVIPDLAGKLDAPPAADGTPTGPLRATFTLTPPESTETIDLETNYPLLEELAVKSGGNRVFTAEDVTELVDLLARQTVPLVEHHEQRLWQSWVLLVLVMALLTLEWVGRKWAGLP
jgi:hypothetical protein